MNGRKYIMQQKLKKDTARFKKKLYLSKHIEFFSSHIKTLSSEISDILSKKNIALTHSENSEDILKYYIAELNLKIHPESYKKNYGDENIRINLSNLKKLTYFQKLKRDTLNNDRKILEDNIKDMIELLEEHRKNKIKKLIKNDINTLKFYEEKRKELDEMKESMPELLQKEKINENLFRESKFLYDQIIKQNKILEIKLKEQKELNELLKQEMKNIDKKEKNFETKKIKNGIGDGIKRKKIFEKMRSLSDDNFLFDYKSANYYDEINENKNKKINKKETVHSLLFDKPKFEGYKSPISFLNYNKIKLKKLFNNERPINPYNYFNIFTNNHRYDSIGEFIENFNSVNNKKILFQTLNSEKTSTKMNTISSNFSSKKYPEKNKHKIRLFSSQQLKKDTSDNMIILRDYLNDLMSKQKKIIKDFENRITEEIRSNNQIKSCIADCIDDINIELFELKEKMEDDQINEEIIKQSDNALYILTYIFDNCFSGIKNNIQNIINKSRNDKDINIKNFISKHDSDGNNNIILKKNFSFNDK